MVRIQFQDTCSQKTKYVSCGLYELNANHTYVCDSLSKSEGGGEDMPETEQAEVMKTVDGEEFPASDFLVVEDPEKTTTWHLQVKKNGTPDRALAGAAWAALFSPRGHRGNKYEGPMKGEAQDKLKALYNSEEWDMPEEQTEQQAEDTQQEQPAQEMDGANIEAAIEHLMAALEALKGSDAQPEEPMPEEQQTGGEQTNASETFAEGDAQIVTIFEQDGQKNRRAPLEMDVALIAVGPGNSRDNNFYTEEMLARDGKVFEGVTMHVVDHNEAQRSEGTDVSTVKEVYGVREIEGKKHLVARVLAYDPDFCEKTRNRADANMLGKLQCSILAKGEAKPGKVGETDYNIVSSITEARFVDWVTRAGAGGHALQLAELEPEEDGVETQESEPEPQQVTLSEQNDDAVNTLALSEVVAELGKTNLPAASVAALASAEYHELSEVQSAAIAEVARLKAAGGGQPIGAPREPERKVKSRQEIKQELQAVNRKYTGGR